MSNLKRFEHHFELNGRRLDHHALCHPLVKKLSRTGARRATRKGLASRVAWT